MAKILIAGTQLRLWLAQCPVIRKSWIFAENPGLSKTKFFFLFDNPRFSKCLVYINLKNQNFQFDNPRFSITAKKTWCDRIS